MTMAESIALISAAEDYGEVGREFFLRRCDNTMDAALAAAEAADAAPKWLRMALQYAPGRCS